MYYDILRNTRRSRISVEIFLSTVMQCKSYWSWEMFVCYRMVWAR